MPPITRNFGWRCVRAVQRGVTLVELLIAMVISLVVIIAASSVYLISGQSFNTVDAGSQLQDSARFGTYILRRMVQQAGFEDYSEFAANQSRAKSASVASIDEVCVQTDVCGFNNRVVTVAQIKSGNAGTTGTLIGPFYTDTLAVQFQGQSPIVSDGAGGGTPKKNADSTIMADGSMIDCSGNPYPASVTSPPDRAMSVLFVALRVAGEPELYCTSKASDTGAGRAAVPLVRGVEVFKVMYEVGTDTDGDGTPDQFRWVRADQVKNLAIAVKPSDNAVSQEVFNWQNVVAVRFGMVVRGELGSATKVDIATGPKTLYPLGTDLSDAANPGSIYVPPNDTRLRRVVTFTTHIRNKSSAFSQK